MSKLRQNANFEIIQNSKAHKIDQDNPEWIKEFSTGGRVTSARAFIMLSVAGLTSTRDNPKVEINGQSIGSVRNYHQNNSRHWHTQIIPFNPAILNRDVDTKNQISIKTVDKNAKTIKGDTPAEDFFVKDVLCIYQRVGLKALDFKVVQGPDSKELGTASGGKDIWRVPLDVFPGHNARLAYLMCSVKGLTHSDNDVDVLINGQRVGDIDDYSGQNENHWFTQGITLNASVLEDGRNELKVDASAISENFFMKNLVCFYHESVPANVKTEEKVFGFIPVAVDKIGHSIVAGDYAWLTDNKQSIGDKGDAIWRNTFDTVGRLEKGQAFILLTVSGLTESDVAPNIKINNQVVGNIELYSDAKPSHAYTQMLTINPRILQDGENTIEIEAVRLPDGSGNNLFDDFSILAAVCFYHRVTVDLPDGTTEI